MTDLISDPFSALVIAVTLAAALAGLLMFVLGRRDARGLSFAEKRLATSRPGMKNSHYALTRKPGEARGYFDLDDLLADEAAGERAASWYEQAILELKKEEGVDRLVFVEKDSGPVGAIALKELLTSRTKIPSCIVRLRRAAFLHSAALKGNAPAPGDRALVVSDVMTTASGHVRSTIDLVSRPPWSAEVVGVVVLVNRGGDEIARALRSEQILLRSDSSLDKEFSSFLDEKEGTVADASPEA